MMEFKMVAIKDFEMPDCCWNCKIIDGFESCCSITGEFLDAFDMKKKRGDKCPLTEVIFYGKDLNG